MIYILAAVILVLFVVLILMRGYTKYMEEINSNQQKIIDTLTDRCQLLHQEKADRLAEDREDFT
jgi:predicted Holliday junction resolvase-like endonuclease